MTYRNSQPSTKFLVFFFIAYAGVLLNISCQGKRREFINPPGYELNRPFQYKMPTVLDEISGIIYYAKDSSLFAIQDEKGFLFKIHLGTPLKVEKWKFSTGGDYEDLALVDSNFYVLKSKGTLEKFKFFTRDSIQLQSFKVVEEGKNEFETLFYDSTLRRLILICKNCEDDKKKEVSSWAFDPLTDSFSTAFVISTAKIKAQLSEEKFKFKPSAGAIHPLTGELYLVSSVDKVLVILNKDHSIKNSYRIDPALFKQPEGMTFTPNGDLIISNEAADNGSADILFFKYHKTTNQQ